MLGALLATALATQAAPVVPPVPLTAPPLPTVTLPRVDMPIRDGKVVVTGSPTRSAADTLVRELKGR